MKNSLKLVGAFILGLIVAISLLYFIDRNPEQVVDHSTQIENSAKQYESALEIDELTEESKIINYVKIHYELPEFYLTKSEARRQGWVASKGNLCEVLPGKAIGGDKFSNRERKLPQGNKYFEADVNYICGRRNADRIVFTKQGEVWLTHDHYKTFQKQ